MLQRLPARLLPLRDRILHTLIPLSLDSCCRPTARKSSSPARLFLPLVYAYVVDCAPASPYTYSSSTHRFPDERTPIEATPLSATSAELGLGLGLGLGWGSLSSFSSHALPFFSPPSFQHYPFPPRSLVCGGQTSPHKPRLVVSHSTCPPLSPSPHANSFIIGNKQRQVCWGRIARTTRSVDVVQGTVTQGGGTVPRASRWKGWAAAPAQ